ncbi:MAG: hypothetical protein GC131_07010 [Alphaproteobacteria bacterium]|nr:hypothetical protein [Alphaproteobacteria bacterium]
MFDKFLPKKPSGRAVAKAPGNNMTQRPPGGQLSRMFHGVNNKSGRLPPAALIYGLGSSAIFVISLFTLFAGSWFTGTILLVVSFILLGYALHFIKTSQ